MNELVRLGTLPRAKLPDASFKSSAEYFTSLSQLHLDHLTWQRNDAIQSEADCRRKYVARHLFQKLASEGRLLSGTHNDNGPFRIWCDDLRPSNILLDSNLQIVGVIDWEFAYAAPAEFSAAPPWWLLLEQPEYWPNGLSEWSSIYDSRLQTFLKALEECEASAIASGKLQSDGKLQLSQSMRQSWNSGEFWVVYAARKNFGFDAIFWEKLDPKFFGPGHLPEDTWKKRLDLLDQQVRENMDPFVQKRLKDGETRELAWEPDELVPAGMS